MKSVGTLRDHKTAMQYAQSLDRMAKKPSSFNRKKVKEALSFLKRKSPNLKKIKFVPNLSKEEYQRIYDAASINLMDVLQCRDESKLLSIKKKIEKAPSSVKDLNRIMSAEKVPIDELPEETQAIVKQIGQLDAISKIDVEMVDNEVDIIMRDIVMGMVLILFVVIASMLKFYEFFIAAAFLLIGITAQTAAFYIKKNIKAKNESTDPYELIGSFPNLTIDRSEEHFEVTHGYSNQYAANNLLELLKQITRFSDDLLAKQDASAISNIYQHQFQFGQELRDDFTRLAKTIRNDNIRCAKDCIVKLAEKYSHPQFRCEGIQDRVAIAQALFSSLESIISSIKYKTQEMSELTDYGSVTMMVEALGLEIWENFLQTIDGRDTPYKNNYTRTHLDLHNETAEILQFYQQLEESLSTTESPIQLANEILRSAGSSQYLQEDATIQPSQQQSNQQKSTNFTTSLQPYLKGREQLAQKAIPWVKKNADEVKQLASFLWNEDTVTMQPYTYKIDNIKSAINLINNIQKFLETEYFQQRDQNTNNINALVTKLFPTIRPDNGPIKPDVLANVISTGQPTKQADTSISGQQLQSRYNEMANMLLDQTVDQYFSSDILSKLDQAVKSFSTRQKQANTTPPTTQQQQTSQPKQESILTEAIPQGTQTNPVTSQQAPVDQQVLQHATRIALALVDILQKMTNDAYNVIASYYPILTSRRDNNQQSQTT